MNNPPASPVLSGMRMHRQNGLSGPQPGREGHTTDNLAQRLRWRPRRRKDRGNAGRATGIDTASGQTAARPTPPGQTAARPTPPGQTAARPTPPGETGAWPTPPGEIVAAAMQLAIALLTAGLDSPELEAWAADALTPCDADGLANFMVGLHVISALLLNELHEATGEPPAAILQRLAILAEHRRGTPSAG